MQKYNSVGISLPKEIISKIDSERGDISRSRYLLRLLEKLYKYNESRKKDSLDRGFASLQSSESP
jgi:metal-responsive CopG/Arc/MetJ family transcriptional regulator